MGLVSFILHVSVALVGAVVSCGSVVVHRVNAFQVPVGLLLALSTSFVLAWVLRGSDEPRLATSYAAGWLLVFGFVFAGRPEGDFAIVSDLAGYVLIGAALAMILLAVVSWGSRGSGSGVSPH